MKRILIFYSHFAPAFKAGGPVQSLVNLVEILKEGYVLNVVCSAFEMGESKMLDGIKPDTWNEYNSNIKVFYSTGINYKILKALFQQSNPDVVYINGMFLPLFNWLPLYLSKKQKKKTVLAPRGMLQQGALAVKPLKKKIFLFLFRLSRLYKNITWHATDEQEQIDIKNIFGEEADVKIALNIPKAPLKVWQPRSKAVNELKVVYLSLITEKKNLHLVLAALKEVKTSVVFDIYGPIKDVGYWEGCRSLMKDQIHCIQYKGMVSPDVVQSKLQEYHAFILPTKGENFGHAIYESLSVGTPVLISQFTPWKRVQEPNAGITIDSFELKDWANAIQTFLDFDEDAFSVYSKGAYFLAQDYFLKHDFRTQYQTLFS